MGGSSSAENGKPKTFSLEAKQKALQKVLQQLEKADYNRNGPFKRRYPIAEFNFPYINQAFMNIQMNCITERQLSRKECHLYTQAYMEENMDALNRRFEEEVGLGLFRCLDDTGDEDKCVMEAADKGNAIYRDFDKSLKGERKL